MSQDGNKFWEQEHETRKHRALFLSCVLLAVVMGVYSKREMDRGSSGA